jgi:hypothetical protein
VSPEISRHRVTATALASSLLIVALGIIALLAWAIPSDHVGPMLVIGLIFLTVGAWEVVRKLRTRLAWVVRADGLGLETQRRAETWSWDRVHASFLPIDGEQVKLWVDGKLHKIDPHHLERPRELVQAIDEIVASTQRAPYLQRIHESVEVSLGTVRLDADGLAQRTTRIAWRDMTVGELTDRGFTVSGPDDKVVICAGREPSVHLLYALCKELATATS